MCIWPISLNIQRHYICPSSATTFFWFQHVHRSNQAPTTKQITNHERFYILMKPCLIGNLLSNAKRSNDSNLLITSRCAWWCPHRTGGHAPVLPEGTVQVGKRITVVRPQNSVAICESVCSRQASLSSSRFTKQQPDAD